MGKFVDETGNVYGRLVVIRRAESVKGTARWLCFCDPDKNGCGKTRAVRGTDLRAKVHPVRSCGCLSVEIHSVQAEKRPTNAALYLHYVTYRKSLRELSELWGVCKSTVRRWMKQAGIRARNLSDAIKNAYEKGELSSSLSIPEVHRKTTSSKKENGSYIQTQIKATEEAVRLNKKRATLTLICNNPQCNQEFHRTKGSVRNAKKKGRLSFFCSLKCAGVGWNISRQRKAEARAAQELSQQEQEALARILGTKQHPEGSEVPHV